MTLPATAKIKYGRRHQDDGGQKLPDQQRESLGCNAVQNYIHRRRSTKKTDINVGATLVVGAAQATGIYTGTAVLTGVYQ